MKYIHTLLFVAFFSALSHGQVAQQYKNWWYQGWGSGSNWNSGSPVAVTNGQTNVEEGTAVMSDKVTGALLFYTDGLTIWNSTHVPMTNGTGMMGNPSSTQSALIIPRPGSTTQYFVFTIWPGTGLRYSIVDMTLSGGLGAVTATKNVLVGITNVDEKLCGTRHANQIDYWVGTHQGNSNNYITYPITAAGPGGPVVSAVGPVLNGAIGYMNFSPCGKWIGESNYNPSLGVASFNNATGVVSNWIDLNNGSNYSSGFSPDGTKFYHWTYTPQNAIFEVDLNQGTQAAINASRVQIATANNWYGAFVCGKDGKMYIPSYATANMHVINNPNGMGAGVGYVANAIPLSGKIIRLAEPNFVEIIDSMKITITTSTPVCNNSTGTATAVVTGGIKPYSYTWTPTAQTTSVATGLAGGTYTVTVKDGSGCNTQTAVCTIVSGPGSTLTLVSSNSVSCNGGTNGAATTSLTGGTGPFTYSWTSTPVQITPNATNLPAGTFTVTSKDAMGCLSTATVTIPEPTAITGTTGASPVLCNGGSTGLAFIGSSGGTGVHTYLWSNALTTQTISAQSAGVYSVVITDANNCKLTVTVTISQPPALSLAINSSTTNVCAGKTINLNSFAGGGVGPYTYTWSPGPNGSSYNVNEIIAGNYNYILNVTDANGCPVSNNVNLTFNPIPVAAVTSGTICYGDKGVLVASGAESFQWSPVNYTGSTYTVNGTSSMFLTVVGTNVSTGCSSLPVTATLIVNPLPNPGIIASTNKGCVPLCMTFTSSNSGSAIQNCSWDFGDGAFASNQINTDRCYTMAGDYTVRATVTDANGCVSSTTYSLSAYPIPVADFNYSPIKPIENEEVTFTDATHEATIAKWDWYFMNLPKPHSNYQNPTYMYSEAGTYPIALVVTSNHGCTDTIVKTIVVGEDYGIYVPNIFSPNGDGLNDVFQPKGYGITKYELRLFNRWGEELMFTNDFAHGWDGMYKGKLSKEDTYIWKINLTNVFGKSHELSGNVTLVK